MGTDTLEEGNCAALGVALLVLTGLPLLEAWGSASLSRQFQ